MYLTALLAALQDASVSTVSTTVLALFLLPIIIRGIYRISLHPLSKFPGPKLAGASRIPYIIAFYQGRMVPYVCKLHKKYGDVVRIAPDELSVIDSRAWKDVHGYQAHKNSISKHPQRYGRPVNGANDIIIANEEEHSRIRRIFAPAFSDRALMEQEPVFLKYVDLLIEKLHEAIERDAECVLDIVRMYNCTTFDVMGDLAFGEPLNMLQQGEYIAWVRIIFASIKAAQRFSLLNFYPSIRYIFGLIFHKTIEEKRWAHFNFSADRVTRRLETGSDHPDIWNLVLDKEEGSSLTRPEMDANAALFMIAGTETTATLLSGLTYLLLTHPETLRKLVEEIRGQFSSSDDMRMDALARLPYLQACVEEGLRLYPPVPTGLPRVTGSGGSVVCGRHVPAGTTITVPHYAMFTSPNHFQDPLSFVPERWTGHVRYASDDKSVLQPFSFGPRNCVGKNMAYHETRLILAKTLYHFDLELGPGNGDWTDQQSYTIWEKKPLLLKLKPAKTT